MHPYSGGSKLASVSSRPDLQKGVQNEVKETPSRGKVEPPLPPHHQNFSTTPSIEISQLKKKKKKRATASRRSASGWSTAPGGCRLSRARRPRPRRRRRRRPLTAEGTEFGRARGLGEGGGESDGSDRFSSLFFFRPRLGLETKKKARKTRRPPPLVLASSPAPALLEDRQQSVARTSLFVI